MNALAFLSILMMVALVSGVPTPDQAPGASSAPASAQVNPSAPEGTPAQPIAASLAGSEAGPGVVSEQSGVVGVEHGPVVSQYSPAGGQYVQGQYVPGVGPYGPNVGHYAPNAVVGSGDQAKPAMIRGYSEQYGQPESAGMPANYKPFGSWGLYIGGSPSDGVYTNYYNKNTGSTGVEKKQVVAAANPILKQGVSGAEYYPFAYSPAELNSGSPLHSGESGVSSYADFYGSKKGGSPTKGVQAPVKGAKGYQSPAAASRVLSSPAAVGQQQYQQQQVVAYSVPVGSHIIGSQPGTEGAFSPYGIHSFTKYAIKPTAVSQGAYYQTMPVEGQMVQQGAYKPVGGYQMSQPVGGYQGGQPFGYYPVGYYGYPAQPAYPVSSGMTMAGAEQPPQGPYQQAPAPQVPAQPAPVQQAPPSPVQVGQSQAPSAALEAPPEQMVDKQETEKFATKQ